jgi:hypothetical protein
MQPAEGFAEPPAAANGSTAESAHTPPPGSPERRAVLDAMRAEIRRWHGLEVVFVVDELNVQEGWAWLHARPQSRDGRNRYEDVAGLLRLEQGAWRVLTFKEVDVETIRERFPSAPAAVFPAPRTEN